MHTAASLLLPMGSDMTARHQYPPLPPADKSISSPAPASVDTRPRGGAAGSGSVQGAGSAARGRRCSSGVGEDSGAREREERLLSSLSLRAPVVASLGMDLSMDRINEEDPRILDTPPGLNSAMSSPNISATSLPACALKSNGNPRAGHSSRSSSSNSNSNSSSSSSSSRHVNPPPSPQPPCGDVGDRTNNDGGGTNSGCDTHERMTKRHLELGVSDRRPGDAARGEYGGGGGGGGSGGDRASSHRNRNPDTDTEAELGAGVGLGVGVGATKRAQLPGVSLTADRLPRGGISGSGEGVNDGEGKWEEWDGGSNSSENSDDEDDDGIGSETLVVDITENLAEIGEGSKRQDDKELQVLDREEIINLSGGSFAGGSSVNTPTGESAGSSAMMKHARATGPLSPGKASSVGHVQARVWAGQANLDVGVRFGLSLNQGNRRTMEDTATFLADACSIRRRNCETQQHSEERSAMAASSAGLATASGDPTKPLTHAAAYFGIYDGHGGPEVAQYLEEELHGYILEDVSLFPSDIPKAIVNACKMADLECLEVTRCKHLVDPEEQPGKASHEDDMSLKKQMTKQDYSGAVAVIAIVHRPPAGAQPHSGTTRPSSDPKATSGGPTPSPTTTATTATDPPVTTQHSRHHHQQQRGDQHPVFLHVANVGDCRGVLCRAGTAVAVTQDHTPSLPCEAARIEEAGGFVSRGRVNGILGVSRSFGDIHCKVYPPREGKDLWEGQQVISRPDVHTIQLTKADNFLILACDGVWDVLSNQEAVSYVHRRLLIHRDVQRAAVELAKKAIETSGDNCSCIVICLNQYTSHQKRRSSRLSLSSASSGSSGVDVLGHTSAHTGAIKRLTI